MGARPRVIRVLEWVGMDKHGQSERSLFVRCKRDWRREMMQFVRCKRDGREMRGWGRERREGMCGVRESSLRRLRDKL